MNKLRGVILPKKWLEFDEIKDKTVYPTAQNKIEQLEKYIEVKEQECNDLQERIDKVIEYMENGFLYHYGSEKRPIVFDDNYIEEMYEILKGE